MQDVALFGTANTVDDAAMALFERNATGNVADEMLLTAGIGGSKLDESMFDGRGAPDAGTCRATCICYRD
jgi:hypothetical protein